MIDHDGGPSVDDSIRPPVGQEIARLRHLAGLTGQQLADLIQWSQAKISRVETGVTAASASDVRLLGHALNVPEDQIQLLVEQTEHERVQMTDWRVGKAGLASKQREYGLMEERAKIVRVFQPVVIPGLLQTADYARAILVAAQRMLALGAGVEEPASVSDAVLERIRRQAILESPARQFSFVMMESVLGNRLTGPARMLSQIERVREVSQQPNVSIRIIPSTAVLTDPPMHSFEMMDDRVLTIDLFNTSIKTEGRGDMRLYRELFDSYERIAATDLGPMLDKYREAYLDLMRPQQRDH
jgi:transcriptional regulator with XRE-family HTH domain